MNDSEPVRALPARLAGVQKIIPEFFVDSESPVSGWSTVFQKFVFSSIWKMQSSGKRLLSRYFAGFAIIA
jgi:hypothetical protein